MHCASCEFLIEKKFHEIPGVEKVKVNYAGGRAKLLCSRVPDESEFEAKLEGTGYKLEKVQEEDSSSVSAKSASGGVEGIAETLAIFIVVLLAYYVLKRLDFLPTNYGVKEEMTYIFILGMGLLASVSTCLAVTGGLLLGVAAKYDELHPDLSPAQKFKPHIYFNIGRILSYAILGGLTGYLGYFLNLSNSVTAGLNLFVSLIMVVLGFQLLGIFKFSGHLMPKMPKIFAHKIHKAQDSEHVAAPFLLGAATFFLPCGFTQSLQLYVLSRGNALEGAAIMAVFALGTLPALLSLGTISSFVKGEGLKYFLKFAGVVVVLLGLLGFNAGLRLVGIDIFAKAPEVSENVEIVDGKQIVEMKIIGLDYYPKKIRVKAGIPVEWTIDSSEAIGCGQSLSVPSLNVLEFLNQEGKTIEFTPEKAGTIPFTCSMGMTSGSFEVVE